MKRALAVIAVVVAIAVVAFFTSKNSTKSVDGFAAYEGGTASANNENPEQSESVRRPDDPLPSGVVRKTKVFKRKPDHEDTLNRPGPEGGTPPPRREVDRRPREGEKVGKQDEPARGSLNKEDVRSGIDAVRPLLKVCYEESLKEFPDAAGKVTLGFRIIGEDGKGRVEMSELEEKGTTLFDEKLHECLQKSISEAEFEVPSGGGVVDVRYPFVFESDPEDD